MYRNDGKRKYLRSFGHYRLGRRVSNITPFEAPWTNWYRMPYEEYTATHRFHPYYMIGQLDYSKEVLIPRKRNGEDGFFVLNPLYCYDGGQIRFNNLGTDKSHIKIKRAAVVINRGWIPYHLKDKKKRPHEINSRELMKIRGVWR